MTLAAGEQYRSESGNVILWPDVLEDAEHICAFVQSGFYESGLAEDHDQAGPTHNEVAEKVLNTPLTAILDKVRAKVEAAAAEEEPRPEEMSAPVRTATEVREQHDDTIVGAGRGVEPKKEMPAIDNDTLVLASNLYDQMDNLTVAIDWNRITDFVNKTRQTTFPMQVVRKAVLDWRAAQGLIADPGVLVVEPEEKAS